MDMRERLTASLNVVWSSSIARLRSIWRKPGFGIHFFLKTAGSPFNNDLWLLSSWILQIKVLEPEITDIAYYIDRPTRFQDLLSQIFVIAARAEKSTGKAPVELLEEPDRRALAVFHAEPDASCAGNISRSH